MNKKWMMISYRSNSLWNLEVKRSLEVKRLLVVKRSLVVKRLLVVKRSLKELIILNKENTCNW